MCHRSRVVSLLSCLLVITVASCTGSGLSALSTKLTAHHYFPNPPDVSMHRVNGEEVALVKQSGWSPALASLYAPELVNIAELTFDLTRADRLHLMLTAPPIHADPTVPPSRRDES